ncbi:MAG: ribosome biogenesis GTP-binding protein YihA/YsxC, partial [Bacteroidales bacterium]
MTITSAEFVSSSPSVTMCPKEQLPEYAFIGRSNVGKSSLINMLVGRKKLARISSTPGKTRLINHFRINKEWLLADLPGYGYAKVSKKERESFARMIQDYGTLRTNLVCFFVLVDARIPPQQLDLDFME